MADDQTNMVDLTFLETFRTIVGTRLDTAQGVLDKLTGELGDGTITLGGFADATTASDWYTQAYDLHVQRARRLVNALAATQNVVGTIIDNYLITEGDNAEAMTVINQMFDDEELRMEQKGVD